MNLMLSGTAKDRAQNGHEFKTQTDLAMTEITILRFGALSILNNPLTGHALRNNSPTPLVPLGQIR
jgi:hypothetical protein